MEQEKTEEVKIRFEPKIEKSFKNFKTDCQLIVVKTFEIPICQTCTFKIFQGQKAMLEDFDEDGHIVSFMVTDKISQRFIVSNEILKTRFNVFYEE